MLSNIESIDNDILDDNKESRLEGIIFFSKYIFEAIMDSLLSLTGLYIIIIIFLIMIVIYTNTNQPFNNIFLTPGILFLIWSGVNLISVIKHNIKINRERRRSS